MSDLSNFDEYRLQQRGMMQKMAEADAGRVMREHGVWTMALSIAQSGNRRQCFATMNAVTTETAKFVAEQWLRVKYGVCTIEFKQTKAEREISTSERVYFHAIITDIYGFPDESEEQ